MDKALHTLPLTRQQQDKILSDLQFIAWMKNYCTNNNLRLIVAGGYSVDGSLGEVTRSHNDIDLQIYGNQKNAQVFECDLEKEIRASKLYRNVNIIDQGRTVFYHSFRLLGPSLFVDLYYLQTLEDPLKESKQIKMMNGNFGPTQQFFTSRANLLNTSFEITSPVEELVDKRFKREVRKDEVRTDHDQDIRNLQNITDEKEVVSLLKKMQANSQK